MPDQKISQLTAGGAAQATDLLPVARSGTNVSLLAKDLATALERLAASGQSLTGSQATSLVDLAATWNTTGTPTAIKLNVTDTASNASSLLMDLQVGGTSRFYFTKNGNFQATGNLVSGSSGLFTFDVYARSLILTNASPDVVLARDAANTLAQRNSTNAQTFRLYTRYDTASDFRRLSLTSATFGGVEYSQILAETGGTYASSNVGIVLSPKGTGAFSLQMPDGTTAGGNARGTNAVDLTMARSSAANVASGANSFAVAGTNTRAQGANSVALSNGAADGSQAFAAVNGVASGTRAFAFGNGATASGQDAIALPNSTASGQGSFAATNGTASGVFATAFGIGGSGYLRSQFAVGARGGDGIITGCQMSYVTLSTNSTVTTSNATTLTIEGASDTTLRPVIPADTTWGVFATVIGRTRNGISNVMFRRQCIIKRDGSNNTTLVGSVQTLGTDIKTDADLDMSVSITADDTNEALKVDVTGKMGGTVSTLTSSGTTCTLTSTANHGLSTGDYVTIAGANETAYNGTFVITRTGATTFTYTAGSTPSATPATGTITANISCRWLCKLELTEHRFPA